MPSDTKTTTMDIKISVDDLETPSRILHLSVLTYASFWNDILERRLQEGNIISFNDTFDMVDQLLRTIRDCANHTGLAKDLTDKRDSDD